MKQRVDIEEWLTAEELGRVRDAVRAAEKRTSGEIRVHLDVAIMEDVLDLSLIHISEPTRPY